MERLPFFTIASHFGKVAMEELLVNHSLSSVRAARIVSTVVFRPVTVGAGNLRATGSCLGTLAPMLRCVM
jgi:hypothetical protein